MSDRENILEEFYNSSVGQGREEYERSHNPRFNLLIEDLKLNEIKNKKILDIGCGYGPIYTRMNKENNNKFVGIDASKQSGLEFEYHQKNLDYEKFSETFNYKFDYILSFETFEHLSNPYHVMLEIKKLMHENSIFYLSIPDVEVTHNTFYPGLIYPVQNFAIFLQQMAFEIISIRQHRAAFIQNVFELKSKDWCHCKMLFYKHEEKFRCIPPHVAINI